MRVGAPLTPPVTLRNYSSWNDTGLKVSIRGVENSPFWVSQSIGPFSAMARGVEAPA